MQPIIFNNEKPLAHFEAAGKLREKVEIVLNINLFSGIVLLVLAFPLIYKNPDLLAYFFLFNVGYIGSNIAASLRKVDLTLIGFICALLLGMVILSVGLSYQGIIYLIMAVFQFVVHHFVLKDRYLSELFGYPHFSVALAEASLATLNVHGANKMPYTADEHKDERERVTTKNTNGIRAVEQSSDMDVITYENMEINLPDKTKQKKDKKSPQQKNIQPSVNTSAAQYDEKGEVDVLSLDKPPDPVAPPSFNPQEYSANVENEMKTDTLSYQEQYVTDINGIEAMDEDDGRPNFNEKKETYSDYLDKKSILLADKNTEDTNDIDLLF